MKDKNNIVIIVQPVIQPVAYSGEKPLLLRVYRKDLVRQREHHMVVIAAHEQISDANSNAGELAVKLRWKAKGIGSCRYVNMASGESRLVIMLLVRISLCNNTKLP